MICSQFIISYLIISLDRLQKERARTWWRQRAWAPVSRCITSSPASSPGRCAIAVAYVGNRSERGSATSARGSSTYATDGPIRRWLPAARGRCPGRLATWSKAELRPSWRSEAVRWLVHLDLRPPPNSSLWWLFLGPGGSVDLCRYTWQSGGLIQTVIYMF